MSWKILDQKKHFDLKRVIVICRMCTGKLFYKKKYLTRIMSMSHWAKVDILHYKTDFIKIFLQGKFWQFQSFIPYNLNTLHMYVCFFFHFSLTFSHILSSLKFKNAIQKNGYGGKDKHLQMRLIFSFS